MAPEQPKGTKPPRGKTKAEIDKANYELQMAAFRSTQQLLNLLIAKSDLLEQTLMTIMERLEENQRAILAIVDHCPRCQRASTGNGN